MKLKKTRIPALAGALALGLLSALSFPALAADGDTTYTITIPSTLTVANSGWNDAGGISATGTLASGKKLTVTAASTNNWALKSGENAVGYNMATATGTYSSSATPASWEFTELSDTATTKPMGIIVEDYSTKPAGTYQDTVTFTASVEDAKQLYSITLTGPYSKFTLVMEFYEGDTWNDMATKYPDYIKIYNKWPGFHTDGLIYEATGEKVLATDVIDPNKTYKVE